jgi:hypothetical protein
MARRLISSGSDYERRIGYSRAVVDGDLVFVSGTTGFDYRTMVMSSASPMRPKRPTPTLPRPFDKRSGGGGGIHGAIASSPSPSTGEGRGGGDGAVSASTDTKR